MAKVIGFKPDEELAQKIKHEQDRVEEETGYRPNKSDVVRQKLREGFDESADQKGAA